jgi:hypothetical protein
MNASPRRTRLELRLERLDVTRRGMPWWGLNFFWVKVCVCGGGGRERVCDKNNDNGSYPHSLDVRDGAVELCVTKNTTGKGKQENMWYTRTNRTRT